MARTTKLLDIFLSSPNDVSTERDRIVELAHEWNSLHSRSRGVHINIITWEDVVTPALSDRAQDVVNEQIGYEYDVYLGMMWSRFGAPTGKADSGTVEEYEIALRRLRDGDAVTVAMIFKTTDIPTAILDGVQFDKVKDFKKRYAADGGMYREFSDNESLRAVVLKFFEYILNDKSGEQITPIASIDFTYQETNIVYDPNDTSDIGLLEFNEALEKATLRQGIFFDEWSEILGSNTALIENSIERFEDATKLGSAKPNVLTDIMKDMASGLDLMTSFIESRIGVFVENNERIATLSDAGIDILSDFRDNPLEQEFLNAVEGVVQALAGNVAAGNEMLTTLQTIPRLSTVYNKARNRFQRAVVSLLDETNSLENRLREALAVAKRA